MKITKKYPTEDNCQSDRNSGSRNYTTGTSSVGSHSMQEEIWKDVKGYEGYYQVSSLGNVKSKDREIPDSRYDYRILKGKEVTFDTTSPYKRVSFCREGGVKKHLVHRLVAIAFIPNPENKREVNHINGIKEDNSVENLEWATPSENVKHAFDSGLRVSLKGSNCGASKLTEEQVIAIRELYAKGGVSQKKIGDMYGVADTCISRIITGKRWGWLK